MNKTLILSIWFLIILVPSLAQNVFTIEEVIHRAQTQSPAFKQTETRRENRYWQYRYFKSNYNPQIRASSIGGSLYTNSYSPIRQPDGSIIYQPINQVNPGINFALQQPLQWTGGTLAVNTNTNYFRDITNAYTQWNGSPMNISLTQPLLSYNPYKWDKRIEPIKYEESKREYAEGMELISHDAVNYFFGVLIAQVNLQIASFNLANNDTIYKIEQGRYNIGKTSEDKLLQVELQLLRSRQDVSQANLDLQTARQFMRAYIGLRTGEDFELVLPGSIPKFTVTEEEALDHAKATRSAYIAFGRRKAEAEAAVAQTRGGLYQVTVGASFGLNNQGETFTDIYKNPTKQQVASLSFSVPILDWGRRRAQMQTAYANKRLNDYVIAQDEVNFDIDVVTKVRTFNMLYGQIEITRKADEVGLKRYVVAQNRYLSGLIDITNLNIALNEKDSAKRSYVFALQQFWTAYYDLRRVTLYDFAEGRYLYNPNAVD